MKNKILSILILIYSFTRLHAQISLQTLQAYDYTLPDKLRLECIKYMLRNGEYPTSQALLYYLNQFRPSLYANKPVGFFFRHFNDTVNVTAEIRTKVLSLVKNEWTREEVIALWQQRYEKYHNGQFKYLLDSLTKQKLDALRSIPNNPSDSRIVANGIYDSLTKSDRTIFESQILNKKVDRQIILTAAWLGLKEAMPVLQKALANKDPHYDSATTVVALAKLGDSACLREVFAMKPLQGKEWDVIHLDQVASSLLFIGSQESIYALSTIMDTTQQIVVAGNSSGGKYYSTPGAFLLSLLLEAIKNETFKPIDKVINKYDVYNYNKIPSEQVIAVRDWLIDNKGKYEIDFRFLDAYY